MSDLELEVDLAAVIDLGKTLRAANFKVTAVICDETLIAVEPGDTTARRFAIAFDLGTTTVVATLLDVGTGQPLAVQSVLNRQQPYGADVISRVSATMMDADAKDALQRPRPGDPQPAHRRGAARRPAWRPRRCTRSSSAATRR